jgi:hypothetical protein
VYTNIYAGASGGANLRDIINRRVIVLAHTVRGTPDMSRF